MQNSCFQRFCLVACLGLAQPAFGYLGGFEDQDGYLNGGTNPIRDVSGYNAGQYGTNNGGPGGSFTNITPNTGLFFKNDIGDISVGEGELVALGLAHTGFSGLVLRASAAFGDTAGDGANYRYTFDERDFNGQTPSSVTSGVVSFDYWSRPQTSFFQSGTVTTTEFLNANGDTVFAVGTLGQGSFTSRPIIQWMDAGGWHNTGIEGNNADWDHIMLSFDLSADLVSFSFYSSLDLQTYSFASNVAAAKPIDSLSGIRFTAAPDTAENAYDDFAASVPVAVPEPGAVWMALIGGMQCLVLRRRRKL